MPQEPPEPRARDLFFQGYLREETDPKRRALAEDLLAKSRAELQRQRNEPPPAPPLPLPLPAAPAVEETPKPGQSKAEQSKAEPPRPLDLSGRDPAAAAPAPGLLAQEAAAEPPPLTRRWWFWTAVGAGVLALAGGTVAYYASGQPPSYLRWGPSAPWTGVDAVARDAVAPARGPGARAGGRCRMGCQRDKTVTQSGLTGLEVTVSYDPRCSRRRSQSRARSTARPPSRPAPCPIPAAFAERSRAAVILLPETLAGKTVLLRVDGRAGATIVGSAQESVRVERAKLAKVTLTLGAPAICGDNAVRAGIEGCDDGNAVSGDGCSEACQTEARAPAMPLPARRLLRGRLLPAARVVPRRPRDLRRVQPAHGRRLLRRGRVRVRRGSGVRPGQRCLTAPACATG